MKSTFMRMVSFYVAVVMVVSMFPMTILATALTKIEDKNGVAVLANSTEAPEGYVPRNETSESVAAIDKEANNLPKVLLIEDVLPWDSFANQKILGRICDYDKTTTRNFLNVELEKYGVVVFANDQPFNTYENYAEFKEYLELFASLGGVIVFGACDSGWSEGDLTENLPGNVSKKTHYVIENYVSDPTHLIVTGALTENDILIDEDLIGSYCSHVSFNEESLPAGTKIILRESDTNRPTLIEYPLGKGRVIASGLTWEYAYDRAGQIGWYADIGYYAQKSMEDMFRYAIRVSSIDVDELYQLEDWRINKKAHTIIVADSSNGMNSLTPIVGANVRVEEPADHIGVDLTTDANGAVVTTDYGLRTVSVTANGYRDYAELYQISEQTSRIIPLKKDKNDGLPYISMCSATKNGDRNYVDLRNQALHYIQGKSDLMLLWLRGNWGKHGEGYFRVYQESVNGNSGKEFQVPVGSYLNIMPGKYFVPGVPVKIQMIAADGVKSEVVDLNIEINKALVAGGPTENTAIEEFTSVDWLGNFPISSDNDVFSKLLTTDMSVSSELIPVEVVFQHNDDGTTTHKITIGFIKGEGSKNIQYNKTNEQDFELDSAWKTLKDEVKRYKRAGNPKEYWNKLDKKYGRQLHGTRLRASAELDFKFLGFAEVTTDQNGKIINSDGGLITNLDGSFVFGKTFFAGPVPLYFEFKPGFEAEISGGVTFYNEENGLTFKLNFEGLDIAIPTISLEGGVGVRGVATAGLNGTGKLKFGFLKEDAPVNVDLSLDGSVHIKVLFVADYKWSFASTNIHFYPKTRAIDGGFAMAMSEIDESSLSLTTRDYLKNTTSWLADPTELKVVRETPVSTKTLQQGTMPDAMPQIHQINGKQIILFLRDVENRETGNHTQLVYSIEKNGIWSEPVPVFESETADFFFNSAVCNGKLVVAWQKTKNFVHSFDASELLTGISSNSEIFVASFDGSREKFTNVQCLTDNTVIDMMPIVSADTENIYISWVSNDANNVLGSAGNYHIYQATLNGDNAEIDLLYSTKEYVVEIAAGEKNVLIATANTDGTSNLYMISGNNAVQIAASTNAAGLVWNKDIFMWQADGGLYGYAPQNGIVETIVDSATALSSSYEYINNGARTAVVWTESTEEGYQVKASFRCDNIWSDPLTLLSGQDDTVAFMDAQMLDDDSISLIMNAVSYTDKGDVELTSLQYTNIIPRTNISLALAEPEHPDWKEQTQQVDIVLENIGEYPIYSVTLCVENGSEILSSNTESIALLPGESMVISKEVNIRNIHKITELTISAKVNNDYDISNNHQKFLVGKTDTSLSVSTYIQDEEYLFVLTATNQSNTDANAAISIIEDNINGVVLSMKNIGVINNTDNIQYLYTIDRSKVNFAGADTKTFFFLLSTLEDDWFESDNVCSFTMKAPDLIVSDPNGPIEVIDVVEPLSVEITENTLHFDSVNSDSVQIHATVLPENATNTKVFWAVEDDSVVHISEDGVVTPLNAGTTIITATVGDGIKDAIQVSVGDAPIPIESISLDIASKTIKVGETFDLTAIINPLTQNEGYIWSVDDASVVSISGNTATVTIEGLKAGTTTVTIKGNNGTVFASCEVTVIDYIPGDIDQNGVVNRDDVIELLFHVSMPKVFPIPIPADYNGDGLISREDVILLLLWVSVPDSFPLIK